MAMTQITEATPMMMPSMVRKLRRRCAWMAPSAERMHSWMAYQSFCEVPGSFDAAAVAAAFRWPQTLRSSAMRPSCSRTRRLAAGRDGRIVRDDHDGLAFGVQLPEQVHDLARGAAVEVAGGLVGQQQLRLAHQRARHGDALPLAAGHFVGRCNMRSPRPTRCNARVRVLAPSRRRQAAIDQRLRDIVASPSCAASGRSSGTRSRSCGCAPRPAGPRRGSRPRCRRAV